MTNPATRVNAQLYTNTANSIQSKPDYSNKTKVKELISKVAKRHGVDEKLVNALVNQESGCRQLPKDWVLLIQWIRSKM